MVHSGDTYCTKNAGCTCPKGSSYSGPDLKALSAESALAVTGGPDGSNGSAAGQSLDDFCKKPVPNTKLALPDPCKIVNQAEASAAAGRAARPGFGQPVTAQGLGTGVACIYRDQATPSGQFGVAYVRVEAYDLGDAAAAGFAGYESSYASLGTVKVAGLGDGAFRFSVASGPTHLYVRRANLVLHFAVLTGDGVTQATTLARIALGRV